MAANEINDSFKTRNETDSQARTFEPDLGQPCLKNSTKDRPLEELMGALDSHSEQIQQAQEWVSSVCHKLSSIPAEYLAGWADHNASQAAKGEPAYVELLKFQKAH